MIRYNRNVLGGTLGTLTSHTGGIHADGPQSTKAQATAKDYKLADSAGLYLFVTKTGFKSWRMKYRFGGKERRLVFGPYPEISLIEARKRRDEARRELRADRDPTVEAMKRRVSAVAERDATFEVIGRRWHAQQQVRWAPVHAADVLRSLERDAFPSLGSLPIAQIDAQLVLATLRKVEARGSLETARRTRQRMSAVFVHAISEGICSMPGFAILVERSPEVGCVVARFLRDMRSDFAGDEVGEDHGDTRALELVQALKRSVAQVAAKLVEYARIGA
ncbi:MAG TPA: integrase arm-type DNA-binding domain-containing protein [Allosphingosinicella sp.]|uniref:tyrosine-type recombinase/integrase n=1 Tax=Allosphingosinicella sp. TaxID=2823234 RepID=UPI002F296A1B